MKIIQLFYLLHIFKFYGALFPIESESREIKVLDGLWNFRIDDSTNRNLGFIQEWYSKALKKTGDVMKMPVPSSYNDITQDVKIRDFVGWVWYDREFFVPNSWDNEEYLRVVMRFESCHYNCIVWVNGEKLMEHDGGHLPFEDEISHLLKYGASNLITVAANNTLTPTTLPPGSISYLEGRKWPPGYFVQDLQMDFFNYAGIHRPVKLYTTPTVHLLDINLDTDFDNTVGILNITSSVAALESAKYNYDNISMLYEVYDADGEQKANLSGTNLFKCVIKVQNVNLWWPVDMSHKPGYMYTLQVTVSIKDVPRLLDVYRLPFGFRTVQIDSKSFKINDKPFYFKGFGMHEDSNIRGKGLDLPLITKDFNLLEWIGANAFRTSHYPYADEIMDFADRQGIVVIDESPGVGIQRENMKDVNIIKHKNVMKELIHRDKNHPSVVMWSVANEPESQYDEAENYFKQVIEYTRELDPTRPVTFVGNQSPYDDKAVKFNDVICYNHYYAWYHDFGHLDLIQFQLESDLNLWYNITGKLFILSEYGADAVAGLYQHPPVMFTEDFQVEALKQYFPILDKYRKKYVIGEMIWNFADFATDQSTTRVAGNKKGVFTRQRQPKHAAYVLRERYRSLSSEIKEKSDTRSSVFSPEEEGQDGYNLNFVVV